MSKNIGRFEYVKRGLVGVCAATMLAGMCAVPAFAAGEESLPGEATQTTTGDTMSTTVTANTTALGQINVTVPTAPLSGVADVDGTLTFGSYTFTNNSTLGIKVTKMAVAKNSGANLVKADAMTTDNAINVKAKIGSAENDLADFVSADGVAVAKAPTIAKDGTGTIIFTGSIANATKAGIGENLPVASVVWTLETV